ncbi:hypothetical protein LguiA_010355 [Lonicera macranthoides]
MGGDGGNGVVTRANKGIGLEICKQLASNGVFTVSTARIKKGGIDALHKLKGITAGGVQIKLHEVISQTDESTVQCVETNYYGTKRMIEAFIPLLQLSDSPS